MHRCGAARGQGADRPLEMKFGRAIIIENLRSLELRAARQPVYDGEFELQLLYEDADSGEEHYLARYPAGLKGRPHRHTAAHTIVVLDGRMEVNDRVVEAGSYVHFPPNELMHHAPAGDEPCLFLILFHGPFDVEPALE